MSGLELDIAHEAGGFRLRARFRAASGATVVFGPSGAGKSLLLSAAAGAYRPDAGRIVIDGEAVFDRTRGVFIPPERRSVGWVAQDALLFPHLSVEANLKYGLARAGRDPARITFAEVVEALELSGLLGRRTLALSGGEGQRVAIGRALLRQPRLLVLDEPLAALDRTRRREILPFIERVRGLLRAPLLYVTHDPEEALRLGDRLVLLEDGEVQAEGTPREVLERFGAFAPLSDSLLRLQGRVLGPAAEGLVRVAVGADVLLAAGAASASSVVTLTGSKDRMAVFASPPPPGSLVNLLRGRRGPASADPDAFEICAGEARFTLFWPRAARPMCDIAPGAEVYVGLPVLRLDTPGAPAGSADGREI